MLAITYPAIIRTAGQVVSIVIYAYLVNCGRVLKLGTIHVKYLNIYTTVYLALQNVQGRYTLLISCDIEVSLVVFE